MEPTQPHAASEADEFVIAQLLRRVAWAALVMCVVSFIALVVEYGLNPERLISVAAVTLSLNLALWRLHYSVRQGAAVFVIGTWLGAAVSTVALAGVHSANWLIFVALLFLTGWALGRVWLWCLTAATILLALGLTFAELQGYIVPTPRASAMVIAVTVVGSLVFIAILTASAYQTLSKGRDRALALAKEMGANNVTLAQRERDLEMIMNQVPAGIASFDTQSRLRMGNVHYAALFGAKPQDLVGRAVKDYVPADTLAYLMAYWERCLGGERVVYRRENHHPVTGAVTVVDVVLEPEYEHGQVVGMFALITDVTEKVAAEAELHELNGSLEKRVTQRTLELEVALARLRTSQEKLARSETKAALSTLVASVSHELSTPIGNSLMTATTLVDEGKKFEKLLSAHQLKRSELTQFVQMVHGGNDLMLRNLQRAVELLANFRQVANDQASQQRRQFDLATMVAEVMETLSPSLRRTSHKVVLDIAPGITMDSLPGALGQVIINLTNNAILHGFEGRTGGVFTISALPPHPLEESQKSDTQDQGAAPAGAEPALFVTLVFEDNGVGIAPETMERLFEPFFSTKKGKGGTGLGMGIVESLVFKTLGGTIRVQSTVGVGTRFEVCLPLRAPEGHART
ncbi:PAS domain-containing sensor histidine kinase [Rhodoferax aquaticus]|uniref:histidine kinase n=1 Tax=Rhodoferax aquaticus TaxID=2527691 RepID=A0A515ER79_9BURK|nr:PAS domain-containing sensor histidine kinase [Rhodoferax aquaticus]QDL55172.1 PAS domain S-box protein [Rhodoferax aquaticus]